MHIQDKKKLIDSLALLLLIVLIVVLSVSLRLQNKDKEDIEVVIKPTIPEFFEQSPKEGLREALKYYNIQDDSVLYCIAYLETGNFTSRLCVEDNNLFGLYDSNNKTFFKFNHWTESIIAYKEMVEYKRKTNETIYHFLVRITYAEDPNYIYKLKHLQKVLQ